MWISLRQNGKQPVNFLSRTLQNRKEQKFVVD